MNYFVKTIIPNLQSIFIFTFILYFLILTLDMILVTKFLSEIGICKINSCIKMIIVCTSFFKLFLYISLHYGYEFIFSITLIECNDITIHFLSDNFIKYSTIGNIIKSCFLFFCIFVLIILIIVHYINYDTVFIIQQRTKYSSQIRTDQLRDNICTMFLCFSLSLFAKISTAYILFRSMVVNISITIYLFYLNGP